MVAANHHIGVRLGWDFKLDPAWALRLCWFGGKWISRTSAWPLAAKKRDSSFQKGGSNGTVLKSPRRQKRPHGYVCVTQKAKLLSSWPQKPCCHGNSRDFIAAHAWVWILGPSLWARKVLSSSLSFLSLFPFASKKRKSFHLYCSVDIGLNDMLYAMEVTCQWNIEAAQGKIRGFFPFAWIVWQVGWRKARESQISEVSRKIFPYPGGNMLEKQYFILKKYLDWWNWQPV